MLHAAVFYAVAPVFVIASLAMPAGIGGGLLYVPLMVVMGVVEEARVAAALGQPLIFGATLAAVSYNIAWQQRHPEKSLVDTGIALATVPACLAGAMVGAVLNQVLPNLVIHVLLLLVLLATLRNAFRKAVVMWKLETVANAPVASGPAAAPPANTLGAAGDAAGRAAATEDAAPAAGADGNGAAATAEDTPHSSFSAFTSEGEDRSLATGVRRRTVSALEVGGVPEQAASSGPPGPAPPRGCPGGPSKQTLQGLLKLFLLWGTLVVSLALRGGKGGSSVIGVRNCSWEYWLITGATCAFLLAAAICLRSPAAPPAVCFAVGALSSVVGMGGGVVLNPMLLGAGLEPMVVTASITVLISMLSSSTTINFLLAGVVPLGPTLVLFAATFLGSLCGKSVVGWLVARTGRNSIIVFLLAGFIMVSSAVVLVQSVAGTISEVSQGRNPLTEFHNPCSGD